MQTPNETLALSLEVNTSTMVEKDDCFGALILYFANGLEVACEGGKYHIDGKVVTLGVAVSATKEAKFMGIDPWNM